MVRQQRIHARTEIHDVAFGFCHGECTSRQRHAGNSVQRDRRGNFMNPQAVLRHQCVHLGLLARSDIGELQILVCRQAQFAQAQFSISTQTRHPLRCGPIDNTSTGDAQRQVQAPILAGFPAKAVTTGGETEGLRCRQGTTETPEQLFLEPRHATVLNGVFQPSMLAVGAVTEITLRGHHRRRHFVQTFLRQVPDGIRQTRERSGLAMRGP